jgi:hypothetical protein
LEPEIDEAWRLLSQEVANASDRISLLETQVKHAKREKKELAKQNQVDNIFLKIRNTRIFQTLLNAEHVANEKLFTISAISKKKMEDRESLANQMGKICPVIEVKMKEESHFDHVLNTIQSALILNVISGDS